MSAGDSESSLLEANVTLAGASLDARSASSAGQKRMVTVHSCFKLLEPADLRSSHPMWMESLTILVFAVGLPAAMPVRQFLNSVFHYIARDPSLFVEAMTNTCYVEEASSALGSSRPMIMLKPKVPYFCYDLPHCPHGEPHSMYHTLLCTVT